MDLKKILFIVLIFSLFIVTYSPHLGYKLPLHFDEWTHISNVSHIKEEGISFMLDHPIEVGFDRSGYFSGASCAARNVSADTTLICR